MVPGCLLYTNSHAGQWGNNDIQHLTCSRSLQINRGYRHKQANRKSLINGYQLSRPREKETTDSSILDVGWEGGGQLILQISLKGQVS